MSGSSRVYFDYVRLYLVGRLFVTAPFPLIPKIAGISPQGNLTQEDYPSFDAMNLTLSAVCIRDQVFSIRFAEVDNTGGAFE